MLKRILFLAALLLCVPFASAKADQAKALRPDAPIATQSLRLQGDPGRPAKLNVEIRTPPGPGPFRLVVWNHGSNGDGKNQDASGFGYNFGIYYFLSRGYAVAVPLLRGYGGSEDSILVVGCELETTARRNAQDIAAVLDQLARMPQFDAKRTVVAGLSFGGWNSLAVGAMRDPRVVGVVNFFGGMRTPICSAGDEALRRGAKSFGSDTRVPSLWFYGDNDSWFPRPVWQAMRTAYAAQGGKVELVSYGHFMSDSHTLLGYPQSVPIISAKLDAFLAQLGLPNQVRHSEYLPMPTPAPTHFAKINDIKAFPLPQEAARDAYRQFLAQPLPRAIVVAPGQTLAWSSGKFDSLAYALADCRRLGVECSPYAIDNDVVWRVPSNH